MRKKIIFIIILVVVAIIIAAIAKNYHSSSQKMTTEGSTPTPPPTLLVDPNSLSEVYTSPEYHFTFKYPHDYKVSSFKDDTGNTVVVQNEKGQGLQIHIEPMDEDIRAITVEKVRQDIPDLVINNPQEVLVGENHKGIAFESDNPAFAGKSREVWFAFNKNFYQITTYMSYDSLLQAIFATWQFK